MRKNSTIIKLRKVMAVLAVVVTTAGSIASGISINAEAAKAATKTTTKTTTTKSATATQSAITVDTKIQDYLDLRMVFTTDLHGMVSSMDYLSGTDFKNGGLSRAYNLIQLTKNERNAANVFTFDVGDVLFEASMEYIMGQDEEAIQPIYLGMAMVGYDAITLGNHDFDYGKSYLLRQLSGSGLLDNTVVSNLTNAKDGSYPFQENMIIERQAVTKTGKTVTVQVGVIGETIPTLSTKTDNYTGIWKTEDIVENVKKESAILKEKGADVIVVLAHSGFGEEIPQLNADNVSYALTKIEDVDAVLCGHEHNEFPTSPDTGEYYNYTGVDPKTGLVNGKVVVMASNGGKSIGVADFTLGVNNKGEFTIEKQSGEVRKVSSYKVQEDNDILASMSAWKEELETYRTKELIQLADGVTLQNYLGLLGDSEVMQFQNNARIAYAREYIESVEKTYAGYPVIAAATHISYGANSYDDFVNVKGSVSYADLFTVQNYRNYTYIYKITGAQLTEWLELAASAYTTLDPTIKGSQFLIQSDWMEDWSQFYVFDGINYTINPYNAPRYDITGKKINTTKRVTNITYNGKVITDDMELIVACNTLQPTGIFNWASKQKIKGMYRTQNIIAEYFASLSKFGKYTPTVDNNWTINFKDKQEFLMLLPNTATNFAKNSSMYVSTEFVIGDETIFKFLANKPVISEPQIIALQSNLEPTMKYYDVFVDAFSSSGIKSLKYELGDVAVDDSKWNYAREIKNNKFTVFLNDTYTIFTEDNNGKRATYKIIVDNIGVKEMAAPKVWSYSNTKIAVTGKAEAGATVYVELKDKTYKGRVNSDGAFSIAVPCQTSGTTFYVYVEDSANGRKSEKTKVYVKYNGPNKATIDKYYNNSQYLTGKTNQEDGFIVVIDENTREIYVNKLGGKAILLASTEVDYSSFNIVEVDMMLDNQGNFQMLLPNIEIGSNLRILNMDYLSRIGASTYLTVLEGGPYAPTIQTALDAEDIIYGNVVSVTDSKRLSVVVTVNGQTYNTVSDKFGNFRIFLEDALTDGTMITAYAQDDKNGKIRSSRTVYVSTKSVNTIPRSTELTLSETVYNSSSITVSYLPNRDIVLSIPYESNNLIVKATTNAQGLYWIQLTEPLRQGALVKVTNRNNLGNLIDANYSLVPYKAPTMPKLITSLTNSSKYIKVVTKEDVSLYAEINGVSIESAKGVFSTDQKGYVHIVKFDRLNSGTSIMLYSKNLTTSSKILTLKVKKVAPDTPIVATITAGSVQITGSVQIFLINSEKEPTLRNTKTKIFAKINGTNYSGTIEKDGSFMIKVPKLEAGTQVSVFAYNRYGYGPETKIMITN